MSTEHSVTCPNCSRQVEAGFKFCDYCGTKLDAPVGTQSQMPDAPTEATGSPDEPKPTRITPSPIPIEVPERKKPLLERMRERRAERSAAEAKASKADDVTAKVSEPKEPEAKEVEVEKAEPKDVPVTPPVPSVGMPRPPEAGRSTTPTPSTTATPPTAPPPRITSKPMRAEELREHQGVAIAGRLRWREGEAPPGPEDTEARQGAVPAPPPPSTTWRPAEQPQPPKRSRLGAIVVFLLHVLVAFIAGAVLVAIAAVVASLASNGRVALLEIRGLPILIAGATAIVVFSLLRTGPRAGDRRSVALGVLTGFVILVAAVTLAYRPSLMETGQRELDRTLGIFGPEVSESVNRFRDDVDSWNQEVGNYRTDLLAVTRVQRREPDAAKRDAAAREFSIAASGVEAALDGVQKRMVSHADAIEQAPLHDAMKDLAAIYSEELGGIRLLTRGFVTNDQVMIKSGDTRFKDAAARAVEFFDERVRPILERADIDPGPLANSIAELTG